MSDLTKDADKLICCIYKQYLEKRKDGISKSIAKQFDSEFHISDKAISSWSSSDIDDTLLELYRADFIIMDLTGNFRLLDQCIIYMENRFKNGLMEVLEVISKFT